MRSQTTAVTNSFGYTSREFAEAGLMYYRARFYDPRIGRFISEDLRAFDTKAYAYVRNGPILYQDPTGHVIWRCNYNALEGSFIGGGGKYKFACHSECVDGISAAAWVMAVAFGLGFGPLPISSYSGQIELDDYQPQVNAHNLEGYFTYSGLGAQIEIANISCTEITMGKAQSHAPFELGPSYPSLFDEFKRLFDRSRCLRFWPS